MNWIFPIDALPAASVQLIGGKGDALRRLSDRGLPIPRTLCVTTQAYNDFIDGAGLREKISLELHRKIFSEMRWEEVWDASQRIRLLFLRCPIPADMRLELAESISRAFKDAATVVRSSAPDEDSSGQSFAGLHASYTHLHGTEDVIRHLRLVWASLWSDAALLYRQELGLDINTSAMAVLIQEMIPGQVSGILFTQDPTRSDRALIEGIHGMNPPLVDGKVSPDRWILEADTGQVIEHVAPDSRARWQPPESTATGDRLMPLPERLKHQTPLPPDKIAALWAVGKTVVGIAGRPQDIEWTFRNDHLVLLQARPVTALAQLADGDQRSWYLSLHRSLENLVDLRRHIEQDLIPRMQKTAEELADVKVTDFDDAQLAAEIRRRWEINQHWTAVYWEYFIPFAHGMRLFGEVYNETMVPADPYEFMELLKHQDLISTRRNRQLSDLAADARSRPQRMRALEQNDMDALDEDFRIALDAFVARYGDLSCAVTGAVDCAPDAGTLAHVILETAQLPEPPQHEKESVSIADLEAAFFDACSSSMEAECRKLLSLARSSYRLRDDDNIILGAIEAQLISAVHEGRRRIAAGSSGLVELMAELGLDREGEPNLAAQ